MWARGGAVKAFSSRTASGLLLSCCLGLFAAERLADALEETSGGRLRSLSSAPLEPRARAQPPRLLAARGPIPFVTRWWSDH
jgi:hypothetical protein